MSPLSPPRSTLKTCWLTLPVPWSAATARPGMWLSNSTGVSWISCWRNQWPSRSGDCLSNTRGNCGACKRRTPHVRTRDVFGMRNSSFLQNTCWWYEMPTCTRERTVMHHYRLPPRVATCKISMPDMHAVLPTHVLVSVQSSMQTQCLRL